MSRLGSIMSHSSELFGFSDAGEPRLRTNLEFCGSPLCNQHEIRTRTHMRTSAANAQDLGVSFTVAVNIHCKNLQ